MKSTSITSEVKRMKEKTIENSKLILKVHELELKLAELEDENDKLSTRIRFQNRMVNGLRLNLQATTTERNEYCEKCNMLSKELQEIKQLSMFEFGNLYCSSESLEADGHAFARSLLGKPATPADIAEETAIANGEAHYAIFNGDDF
jgi:predicted RNase H-like nuclease (RuvC/YqgF family)